MIEILKPRSCSSQQRYYESFFQKYSGIITCGGLTVGLTLKYGTVVGMPVGLVCIAVTTFSLPIVSAEEISSIEKIIPQMGFANCDDVCLINSSPVYQYNNSTYDL